MQRRSFLKSSAVAGLSIVATQSARADEAAADTDDLIARVKHAMLTMQRASWEQGVAAQAFLELGDHDTVYLMAKELVLRQTPDGRLGVVYTDHGATDGGMGGETLVSAARRTRDPELEAGLQRQLEWVLHKAPRSAAGVMYHRLYEKEMWIDFLNTVPPLLAAVGKFDEAMKQIRGYREHLWDDQAKLYRHQWSDATHSFKNPNHWGVGNGWAATALVRVIHHLPADRQADRDECIAHVREIVDGCLAHVRPDGMFHDFVDQPNTFVEVNLSQMLAYTIYRGVAGGWLDRGYLDRADPMHGAAHAKVDKFGYVQDVCGAPNFNAPGRATEGQAAFLRMEAAWRDLGRSG